MIVPGQGLTLAKVPGVDILLSIMMFSIRFWKHQITEALIPGEGIGSGWLEMIEQKKEDPERRPKIVNVSSINAFTASPLRGEYCMSKAGMSMMTALFAIRLAEFGIGAYEIRPGITKTDLTGSNPQGAWGAKKQVFRCGRVPL